MFAQQKEYKEYILFLLLRSRMYNLLFIMFLADPGKARGHSTNTVIITHCIGHPFPQLL